MATFPVFLSPNVGTWTLAGTLRNILDANSNPARIELTPQSVLADAEFDTTQTWVSGTTFGSWSIVNNANLSALDENTTYKSRLYIAPTANVDYFNTAAAPLIYQSITGDFDVYTVAGVGPPVPYNFCALVAALSTSPTTNYFLSGYYTQKGSDPTVPTSAAQLVCRTTTSGTSTDTGGGVTSAKQWFWGGPTFVRLKKAGATFSAYWSNDAATWTQIGTNVTRNDLNGATLYLGVTGASPGNTLGNCSAVVHFIRNTLPYDPTSPSASVIYDSGAAGTTWALSTFSDVGPAVHDVWGPYHQIGFGTLAYQYGASNTNPPTLNGVWLSAASMAAQANATGQYFKLAVQFNSANGYQLASFQGAKINATLATGGGGGAGAWISG